MLSLKKCILFRLKSAINQSRYNEEFFFFKHIRFYIFRFYLFIFRQRGREGEREGEKHQYVVASPKPPTGHLACNPGM